jgi:hypothetical protein
MRVVTYNFDPDRWFEIQRHVLDARRDRGELSPEAYQADLEGLERRYEEMTSRLDKPFELNDTPRIPGPPRQE